MSVAPRIRVLQSFSAPTDDDNPYIALTAASVGRHVDTACFTWRRALLGRYDVVHLHWLDPLVYGRTPTLTLAHWVGSLLLLLRLRVTRTPVVRTLHNRSVRGGTTRRAVRLILRGFDALTRVTIVMNRTTTDDVAGAVAYIPHGHYRPWFEQHALPPSRPGRILNFGLVRAYKGIDALTHAFEELADPGAEMHVVGRVVDQDVGRSLRETADRDDRVSFLQGHASDEELAREIGESSVVVLPYDDLFNSGCLLLSLSLGRPTLVPDCEASRDLQSEFGTDWVMTFEPPLTAEHLARALARAAADRAALPDLERRDWSRIGEETVAVYRQALGAPGGPEPVR